jgi:hypothetical protein
MDFVKAVPLPDFESIDILADNADFILACGKYKSFELLNPHSIPLVYQVENKKLFLIQKEAGPRSFIELHIPEGTLLSFLTLHCSRGDVSMEGASIQSADIHLYQGSLFIKHAYIKQGLLEIWQGELCAKKARFEACTLLTKMCEEKQTK